MPNQPSYIKELRALTRTEPTSANLEEVENELYGSKSDRATVVLFGSFVDAHLERLVRSKLRKELNSEDRNSLFEYNGPMSSFSSKILMAYALDIIGPVTRKDLDLMRLLRNEFAHSRIPLSFKTPEVMSVCKEFKIIDLPESQAGYFFKDATKRYKHIRDNQDAKTRFISTCHNISYRMVVKRDGVREGDVVFANDEPLP